MYITYIEYFNPTQLYIPREDGPLLIHLTSAHNKCSINVDMNWVSNNVLDFTGNCKISQI